MKIKHKKYGFTLVELLAVIAILSILVIIALPNVMGMFKSAKKNSFITEIKEIYKTAESTWMSESMFNTNELSYSRCSSGCMHGLDLSGRTELEYYVKVNKSGKIVKLYATDGTFQYSYDGNDGELDINDIKDVQEISLIGTNDIIDIGLIASNDNSSSNDGNLAIDVIRNLSTLKDLAGAKRFTGPNPDNFVTFNGEVWRIIGVYGNNLKIIKQNSIGDYPWNNTSSNSWVGSSLQIYLNNDYYNSLSSNAKDMIQEGTWNIGTSSFNYSANMAYTKSTETTAQGLVGLLSTYEYLYGSTEDCYTISGYNYNLNNTCGDNDWLHLNKNFGSWTISPDSDTALAIGTTGFIGYSTITINRSVFPVVYLKSSVKINSGNGMQSTPYVLGL